MPELIALVEDDADQRRNYANAISRNGFQVAEYHCRTAAITGIADQRPALAVLDIILQDEVDGGFQLCRELLGRYPDLPIIFLTDRIDEIDKISGLRLGAWDYLAKPISLAYLVEKISSLLRLARLRQEPVSNGTCLQLGPLQMYEDTMQANWNQQRVPLTVTEFQLLSYLVRRPGHAISYDALMSATRQQYVTANTINTHMRNIRRKFRQLDDDFSCISNEYGFGYRWSGETEAGKQSSVEHA